MPAKSVAEVAAELRSELADLQRQLAVLQSHIERSKALDLLERLTTLDERVGELKRARDESDRRLWNVLMIGLGAGLSLLGGVVVQLVVFGLRK